MAQPSSHSVHRTQARRKTGLGRAGVLLGACLLSACGGAWNDPYPAAEEGVSVMYTAFSERPKHLDPVQSYAEDEGVFLNQIYEPPLQYHYLKRPYTLEPGLLARMPEQTLLDAAGRLLPEDADPDTVAETRFELNLRPGVLYQPHPALARDADGRLRYARIPPELLARARGLADFPDTGTREVLAEDIAYQIKRLAHPRLHSPILELMSDYILGLEDLRLRLAEADKTGAGREGWLDLRAEPLEGVEVLGPHRLRIRLKGSYPQFRYWLAMTFFAPVPWEADRFHAQPGMAERNLTLDWWPIGSGPYMLAENDPNARMVLVRNPNFRGEAYPCEGEARDREAGRLDDCGKTMPMIDRVEFAREREAIPYWNKFLQGYYDASGISSDNFDQAVQMGSQGDATLSDDMAARGIGLDAEVAPSVMYIGFNQLDGLVGGSSDAARKLRQAISIAIDMEEFVSIFRNGRGIVAQGPIPPGLFGAREGREGINPVVYDWVDGQPRRKSIDEARRLLAEAGWPSGRHRVTGEPLVIHFDTTAAGMGDKARADWLIKQFRKIDVQLVMRPTDFNRFQEKIRQGSTQLFFFGWNADYPDPENFLFLFHGAQARARSQGGVNSANYMVAEFDRQFTRMKVLPEGPARQALIDGMVGRLRADAPWVFGFFPKTYSLRHAWLKNRKVDSLIRNDMKYLRIDAAARARARADWNRPARWPLALLGLCGVALAFGLARAWRRRERATAGEG